MIKPTVGRKVWYHPDVTERLATIGDDPLDATIVGVWSDTCVNLAIHDANGTPHARTSVLLVQCEVSRAMAKTAGRFCEWMPYQQGQAAKDQSPIVTARPIGLNGYGCCDPKCVVCASARSDSASTQPTSQVLG